MTKDPEDEVQGDARAPMTDTQLDHLRSLGASVDHLEAREMTALEAERMIAELEEARGKDA